MPLVRKSGNGGSQTALTLAVPQAAHGFTVGQVVRRIAGSWVLSEGDAAADADLNGMVSAVADADNLTVTLIGVVDLSGSDLDPLTDGADYFLSATVPGGVTVTEPVAQGQVSAPVGKALSTTSFLYDPLRGLVQPAPATKDLLYKVLDDQTAITVATLADFVVGSDLDGWSLTGIEISVSTAPGTDSVSATVKKNGVDMCSTDPTIDAGERISATAAVAPVIKADGTQTVATGDVLAFAGVDPDTTTAADRGLQFRLTFTSP